ncbi:hypothetical protein [Leptolyngbya sp. AN02str]
MGLKFEYVGYVGEFGRSPSPGPTLNCGVCTAENRTQLPTTEPQQFS